MAQAITITLPETIYQRVKVTAEVLSLPVETVVTESIELLLPAFEADMSPATQRALATLTYLSDAQLWKAARQNMSRAKQAHLEALAERQKQRELNQKERVELDQLMQEAQHIMLSKAEACRLLAQRGHTVFSPV
jgi:hypothetical protein